MSKQESQTIKIWDMFDNFMIKNGCNTWVTTPEDWEEERSQFGKPMSALGTKAYKEDKYAPITKLYVSPQYDFVSISVLDRCGNKILDGKEIAHIRLGDTTCETMQKALNIVKEQFLIYDENNTVPTKFEKQEFII